MVTKYTDCDMGQIKIYNNEVSLFFDNRIGDITTKVDIVKETTKKYVKNYEEFLGHFTVKAKNKTYLSSYDCADFKIYTFTPGRYFVYLIKPGHIKIILTDMDLHA